MANILQFLINLNVRENNVTSLVGRLQAKLDGASRSAETLSSRLSGSLSNAIHSLPGAEFFTNPIVAIGSLIGLTSNLGMENEQTAISFEVLLGSQKKAISLMSEMKKYANTTPYESADIFQNAKTMLGFGIVQQSVMKDMRMLGDVAMGNKDKLGSLTLAFSQITSAGKLQGQDLLQLINAGYNPLQDISALTGKSMARLKEEMSKGEISSDLVTAAFQRATSQGGRFYQMTDKIGGSGKGKLSTLFDSLKEKALILYGAIEPILIPAIDALAVIVDAAAGPLQLISNIVSGFVGYLKDGNPIVWGFIAAITAYTIATNLYNIATGVMFFACKAAAGVQWLLNAAMSANPAGLVIAAIAALAVGVAYAWNKFAGFRAFLITTWDVMKGFGNIIKDYIIDRVTGLISGIGLLGSAISKMFKGDWQGAWNDAKKGANGILGLDAIANAAKGTKRVYNSVGATYEQNLRNQNAIQKAKGISTPGIVGSSNGNGKALGALGKGGKSATESAVTGGSKVNNITVNIGKFFDMINVHMMDKADTKEIQDIVIECMTRSLEIATSSAR